MLNAGFIVGLRVSPIIATLGTLNIARGAAFLITSSAILVGLPSNWSDLGTGYMFGAIPYPIVVAAFVAVFFSLLLNYTVFGRNVYAVGGNEEAARIAGVNVSRMYIALYAMSGLATGLAAVVLGSRLGSGDPNIGVGFEFDCIVAVILGGTSLAGGEGRISGTVLGALIVAVLSNGLNLAGVEPFWQYVAKGVALVVAVVIDRLTRVERESSEVGPGSRSPLRPRPSERHADPVRTPEGHRHGYGSRRPSSPPPHDRHSRRAAGATDPGASSAAGRLTAARARAGSRAVSVPQRPARGARGARPEGTRPRCGRPWHDGGAPIDRACGRCADNADHV